MDDLYQYLNNFESYELEKPGAQFDLICAVKLQIAREKAGFPFIINRGADTTDHNEKIGGDPRSLHVPKNSPSDGARAVDIEKPNEGDRLYLMVEALMHAGFNQILIYSAHVHAEFDEGKSPYLAWKEY